MKDSLKKTILSIIDALSDQYWRLGRFIKTDYNRTEKLQQFIKKLPLITKVLAKINTNLVSTKKIV